QPGAEGDDEDKRREEECLDHQVRTSKAQGEVSAEESSSLGAEVDVPDPERLHESPPNALCRSVFPTQAPILNKGFGGLDSSSARVFIQNVSPPERGRRHGEERGPLQSEDDRTSGGEWDPDEQFGCGDGEPSDKQDQRVVL